MKTFYGVHLSSGLLSAAFDLIRYLAEPDSLRFSHITLRGPYRRPLSSLALERLNTKRPRIWRVRLAGAASFFNESQNTVIIRINLQDLRDLFYKPDFQDGISHLTLYDGPDRDFSQKLLNLLYKYDFQEEVDVSKLQKLSSKAPISGEFGMLYEQFHKGFKEFIGLDPSDRFVKSLDQEKKLYYIERILSSNFKTHFENLRNKGLPELQNRLPFDF